MEKTYYYEKETDDVVSSANQDFILASDFDFNPQTKYKTKAFFKVVGSLYAKLFLRRQVVGKEKLIPLDKKGYFIYANHTQPIGDALGPLSIFGRDINIICSPANLGIPVLGKLIPVCGGLVIPSSLRQMRSFLETIRVKVARGQKIMIYPEAHVWPYYTKIRPYDKTSFSFPVENKSPVFILTTTYQKAHLGRPKMVQYIDGPFYPKDGLKRREQELDLCQRVYAQMLARSQKSNVEYVKYVKGEKEDDK